MAYVTDGVAEDRIAKDYAILLFRLKRSDSRRYQELLSQSHRHTDLGITSLELQRLLTAFEQFVEHGLSVESLSQISWRAAIWLLDAWESKVVSSDTFRVLFQWACSQPNAKLKRNGNMIAQLLENDDCHEKRKVLSGIASQILKGKDRWPPKPAIGDFCVSDSDWRQLSLNVHLEGFLLILGPSGCGKTEVIKMLAQAMNRNLHAFSFGSITDARTSIFGSNQYDPSRGTFFVESRFLRAIREPRSIIRLDEVNRCDYATRNCLFSLFDGQRSLDVDEQGSVENVAEQVSFFATANVGLEYCDTAKLDHALLDRADCIIRMDFPKSDFEIQLLMDRTSVNKSDAEVLVKIASEQRKLAAKQEFTAGLSTRRLLKCAEQRSLGVPLKEAVNYTITGHFSNEGGSSSDRTRLLQLIQKYL